MDYFEIYDRLINRAKNRVLTDYFEKHHVVPKCQGGSDSPHNLVNLTPEEHYVAHQLLAKMHPENHPLLKAAQMMIPNRPSNKLYGWIRRRYAAIQKIKLSGTENPSFGKIWIHSIELKKSKLISKDSIIPLGWKIGRVINFDSAILKLETEMRWKNKRKNAKILKIKKKHNKKRKSLEYRQAKTRKIYNKFIESGLSLRQFAYKEKFVVMTLSNWFNLYINEYDVEPRKKANKQFLTKCM